MKQIIPFVKEISFDNKIASMVSIALEHEYYVENNEVNGNFFVSGEYKVSNDSTEIISFKEKIPFNLIVPDNLIVDSVCVDVDDFTYELLGNNAIKVCIDLYLNGEEIEKNFDDVRDLEKIYEIKESNNYIDKDLVDVHLEDINIGKDNVNIDNFNSGNNYQIDNNVEVNNTININNEITEVGEYIIYHIHIVKEGETIENIINQYDTNMDIIKEYNDINKLKTGDKLIIPEIYYGNN